MYKHSVPALIILRNHHLLLKFKKSKNILNIVKSNFSTWNPYIIGIAGGTASGKTSICQKITEKLGQDSVESSQRRVVCISQDAFYRPLTKKESIMASNGMFNFDHPDAFEWKLVKHVLYQLLEGKICHIPIYDYVSHSRSKLVTTVYPADIVLMEGILMLYDAEIRNLCQMKLFIDCDTNIRLARRIIRDTKERGRPLEQVISQYTSLVKPAFEEFCLPTKKFADVIIQRGYENKIAINLIVQYCQVILKNRAENINSLSKVEALGNR